MAWKDWDLVRKGYPDFTIFYSAGKMVRAGMARSLYDERVEFQVQRQFAPNVSIRHGALPYNHPPFEALLFVPFTHLPYLPAYLAWNAVNLGLMGVRSCLRHLPFCRPERFGSRAGGGRIFPIFICLRGQDSFSISFRWWGLCVSNSWVGFSGGMLAGLGSPSALVLPLVIVMLLAPGGGGSGVAYSSSPVAKVSVAVIGCTDFSTTQVLWKSNR
jgi:hypothetical protein